MTGEMFKQDYSVLFTIEGLSDKNDHFLLLFYPMLYFSPIEPLLPQARFRRVSSTHLMPVNGADAKLVIIITMQRVRESEMSPDVFIRAGNSQSGILQCAGEIIGFNLFTIGNYSIECK